jgi:hypothetical protein
MEGRLDCAVDAHAAGLEHVRFHDDRHTALTRLAEKGVPDWVIRAQFGHVSPGMMAVYSRVRRKALDEAAKALEPDTASTQSPSPASSRHQHAAALVAPSGPVTAN